VRAECLDMLTALVQRLPGRASAAGGLDGGAGTDAGAGGGVAVYWRRAGRRAVQVLLTVTQEMETAPVARQRRDLQALQAKQLDHLQAAAPHLEAWAPAAWADFDQRAKLLAGAELVLRSGSEAGTAFGVAVGGSLAAHALAAVSPGGGGGGALAQAWQSGGLAGLLVSLRKALQALPAPSAARFVPCAASMLRRLLMWHVRSQGAGSESDEAAIRAAAGVKLGEGEEAAAAGVAAGAQLVLLAAACLGPCIVAAAASGSSEDESAGQAAVASMVECVGLLRLPMLWAAVQRGVAGEVLDAGAGAWLAAFQLLADRARWASTTTGMRCSELAGHTYAVLVSPTGQLPAARAALPLLTSWMPIDLPCHVPPAGQLPEVPSWHLMSGGWVPMDAASAAAAAPALLHALSLQLDPLVLGMKLPGCYNPTCRCG